MQINIMKVDNKKITLKFVTQLLPLSFTDKGFTTKNLTILGFVNIKNVKTYLFTQEEKIFKATFQYDWSISTMGYVTYKNRQKRFESVEVAELYLKNYNQVKALINQQNIEQIFV